MISRYPLGSFSRWCLRWTACRWRNVSPAATGWTRWCLRRCQAVLPNFVLNYLADRMEMAHSIEGRVPFLDHHVAEAAAQLLVSMKVKGIREKHVLREAAKDVLIPEVYDRQKHPFTTPPTRNPNDPMLAFSTGIRSRRKRRRTSRSTT